MAAVLVLGVTPVPVFILDETGAWREVPGIASIEVDEEPPPPAPERTPLQLYIEQGRTVRDAYIRAGRAYAEAARPVMETLARGLEAYGQALQAIRTTTRSGDTHRPAWQSPYGPARRRR
ncbi:hypothetical protein ACFV3N_16685 [Streptomyces bauhiniae]|uniref:hypothetical protein n=1 Tax=Streptomyces bauhiniae TaxID=2340725 RepID=UPI00365F46B9